MSKRPAPERKNDPQNVCAKGCCGLCKKEFAQQTLYFNRFFIEPVCFSFAYFVIGVTVLCMSMVFRTDLKDVHTSGPHFYKETDCSVEKLGTLCVHKVEVDWDGATGQPVSLYYWMTGFNQVHRGFVMNGFFEGSTYVFKPVQNESIFNDTYHVFDAEGKQLELDTQMVSFPSDIDFLMAAGDTSLGGMYNGKTNKIGAFFGTENNMGVSNYYFCSRYRKCDSTEERQLVWQKASAGLYMKHQWMKLYGRLRSGFPSKGKYSIILINSYPTAYYGGTKGIYLSTMGAYGGHFGSTWLADLSLVFGCVCLTLSLAMGVMQVTTSKRDVRLHLSQLNNPPQREHLLAKIRWFRPDVSTFWKTGVAEALARLEASRKIEDASLATNP